MGNVVCMGSATIVKQLEKVLDFLNSDLMQSFKNLNNKITRKNLQQENMDSATLEPQAN